MEWEWEARTYAMSPLAYWTAVVLVVVLTALGVVLNAVILRKAGHHWLWSVLFLFPLAYVIGAWVFAWARWPRLAQAVVVDHPEGAAGEGGMGARGEGDRPIIAPDPNPRRSFGDRRRW